MNTKDETITIHSVVNNSTKNKKAWLSPQLSILDIKQTSIDGVYTESTCPTGTSWAGDHCE